MSQKVLVATREEAGVTYGRVVKATEHMLMQDFAHAHVERVTRHKLMRNATQAESAGFDYTLPGGMVVLIGDGHAIDVQGRSYDTLPSGANTQITIPAAHVAFPRIDRIIATLVADQDDEPGPLPFRRLLSTSEQAAGDDPYPINNENVNTRRNNVAIISVRQGVANPVPVAPALGANEIPLYQVRVDAGATTITADKVTDERRQMKSLADALVRLDTLEASPAIANLSEAIDNRFAALFGVTPNTGLAGTYNNAANSYALAGVAATAGAMGMMPAADKAKLDAATDQPTVNTLVKRDANGDVQHRRIVSTIATGTSPLQVASQTEVANLNANMVQGQNLANLDSRFINTNGDTMTGAMLIRPGAELIAYPQSKFLDVQASTAGDVSAAIAVARTTASGFTAQGVLGRAETNGNGSTAHGLRGEGESYGTPVSPSVVGVSGRARGSTGSSSIWAAGVYGEAALNGATSGTVNAGYFNGNVSVVGSFTAGSKSFRFDHPLDPLNKTLVYGVVEMPGHGLLLPVRAQLADGAASVSLDVAIGQTPGTLKHVGQRLMVMAVYSGGTARVTAVIEETLPGGGSPGEFVLTLTSDDATDGAFVNVLIIGHRADAFVKSLPDVDGDGILIVEVDKPALTAEDEALLEPVTEEVPTGSPLIGQTLTVIEPSLIGKAGYPWHSELVEGGVSPTREVTYIEIGS